MTNIIGPHGPGVNEAYTRPEDTASGSGSDSWFKDCVNGVLGTGTKIPSVWLNKVTAQIRRAIRGMGVGEAELDDDMLLKAIQKADRGIVNLGNEGVELYAGYVVGGADAGKHQIRRIKAGANVTIDVNTDEVRITAAGASGGNPLDSIGGAADVYKGLSGGFEEIRSLEGVGGIAVTVDPGGDKLLIDGSSLSGAPNVLIEDRKTTGTHGGTFTAGARRRRDLNTLVRNVGNLVTLSGNQVIVLVAGNYWIEFDAPGYGVSDHQAYWRNVSAGTDAVVGASHRSPNTGDSVDICTGSGAFAATANQVFELQHICAFTQASYGFGYGPGFGPHELFSRVKIWRV